MRDVAFVQDPGKPGKSNPTVQTALENVVVTIAWNYRYRQLQSRDIALTKKASPQQALRFNSEGYSESSHRNMNWLVKKLSNHDAMRLLEIQQELISLLITHGQGNIFA